MKLMERYDEENDTNYLQQYQDNQAAKLVNLEQRTPHQLHAKYVISEQQKSETTTNYRESLQTRNEIEQYKYHLRYNRDNSVTKTKVKL